MNETSINPTSATGARLFGDHFVQALQPHERALIDRLRELTHSHFGPNAAEVARQDVFAWDTFRLLAREGLVATAFPTDYGGSDARQALRIRIIEELGRVCSTSASMITGTDLSSRAIVAGASDVLKQSLLPGLCSGELQAAFALTEPGAGSDVRGLKTTMRSSGDGYVLSGRKKFITRATTSDWFVVVGRAEEEASTFIAVLVPRDAKGFTISPEVGKLGWFGVPISTLTFDNVQVPVSHRLGAEGEGFALAQDALLRARIGHAAMALGRAIGAVEIAAAYATDRSTFGKTLGEHQGVQWMLADMVTQIEASRAACAHGRQVRQRRCRRGDLRLDGQAAGHRPVHEGGDRCIAADRWPRLPAGLPTGALLPRCQAEPDRRRRKRSAQDRDRSRPRAPRHFGRAQPVPAAGVAGRLLDVQITWAWRSCASSCASMPKRA